MAIWDDVLPELDRRAFADGIVEARFEPFGNITKL